MTDADFWIQAYLWGFVIFGLINSVLLFMAWWSMGAKVKWYQYLVPAILWPIAMLMFPYFVWRGCKRISKRNGQER